jgi:hypothetical protein
MFCSIRCRRPKAEEAKGSTHCYQAVDVDALLVLLKELAFSVVAAVQRACPGARDVLVYDNDNYV